MPKRESKTPKTVESAPALALARLDDPPCTDLVSVESDGQPWSRLDDETPRAYAAFIHYRDQGLGRSLYKTTDDLYPATGQAARLANQASGLPAGQGGGRRIAGHVGDWSSRYRWVERAASYDAHCLSVRESVLVDSLRSDALASLERDRQLRSNRLALAARIRQRIEALAGPTGELDLNQAKAHQQLAIAVERLQIIEDGANKGLDKLRDHYESKAIPKPSPDDIPSTVPADIAANILVLLSTVHHD